MKKLHHARGIQPAWINWLIGLMLMAALSLPIIPNDVAVAASPGDAVIIIDLDASRLTLYLRGTKAGAWPVTIGKSETPSPVGVFYVNQKAREWGSGFGTRWIGLNCPWGTFGIHGTNRPDSIGAAASHGCFRMYNKDVEKLYGMVPIGAMVIVERGPYGDFGWGLRRLAPGDRGADVRQVQARLNNLGFSPGGIDGVFGVGTRSALLAFKRANQLPYDDAIDAQTYAALGMLAAD